MKVLTESRSVKSNVVGATVRMGSGIGTMVANKLTGTDTVSLVTVRIPEVAVFPVKVTVTMADDEVSGSVVGVKLKFTLSQLMLIGAVR